MSCTFLERGACKTRCVLYMCTEKMAVDQSISYIWQCRHWASRSCTACSHSMTNKAATTKMVNTGTFVWTAHEVGLFLHVEKSEQHQQIFTISCCLLLCSEKTLTGTTGDVTLLLGVLQKPKNIQKPFVSEETSAVVIYTSGQTSRAEVSLQSIHLLQNKNNC